MARPGVLFDVDGTLVDNSYLHTLAWARAFADAGHPVSMAEIHRRIGLGSSLLREAGAVAVYQGPAALLADVDTVLGAMNHP